MSNAGIVRCPGLLLSRGESCEILVRLLGDVPEAGVVVLGAGFTIDAWGVEELGPAVSLVLLSTALYGRFRGLPPIVTKESAAQVSKSQDAADGYLVPEGRAEAVF